MSPKNVPKISLLVAVILLCAFRTQATSALTVSSPLSCRFQEDCPPNFHCNEPLPISICRPKRRLGEQCLVDDETLCRPQLTCQDSICVPRLGPGADCSGSSFQPICRRPLLCVNNKCRERLGSKRGGPCAVTQDCDNGTGLECTGSVCRTPPPCSQGCQHRCGKFEGFDGICRDLRPPGSTCTFDFECRDEPNGRFAVCNNFRKGSAGTCVIYADLRRKLGEPCEVGANMCDLQRGLSCVMSERLGRAVCQHRFESGDRPQDLFCDASSEFSRCPDGMVCRQDGPFGFSVCTRT